MNGKPRFETVSLISQSSFIGVGGTEADIRPEQRQEVDGILRPKKEIKKRRACMERDKTRPLRGGEALMTRFKGRESTVDGLSRDATATIPAHVAVSYTRRG